MSIQGINRASANPRDPVTVSPGLPEQTVVIAGAGPGVQAPRVPPPDREQVKAAVAKIEKSVASSSASLSFSIDEGSGKAVVKVIDTQTGALIRQIPSEEIMAMAKSIDKMQGLLLQHKV
jgi:flagellar protein FlaG